MKFWLQRALRRAATGLAAGLLAAAATALFLLALYFFAAGVLGPLLGALVTAGGALVLAGLILAFGSMCRMRHHRPHPRRNAMPQASELGAKAGEMLKDNAPKAAAAAFAAGLALGVSPRLRRSLFRLLR
jgi:hypothetical protein